MAASSSTSLRRDLGRVQSYAALIGILVGAGIYQAIQQAYVHTGPSLVLGFLVLAPVVLCIAIPYAAFQSMPQQAGPGGDYAHIRAVFGSGIVTFLAAWLKIISYLGALAFLASTTADYLIEAAKMAGLVDRAPAEGPRIIEAWQPFVATTVLVVFWFVHCAGVRWFGRLQVAMCLILGVSILVLIVPGVFAIDWDNFSPFFEDKSGFLTSLPILFFAFAGFEALAHTAGEVRDSHDNLPRVYLRGVLATTVLFLLMSAVVVGVLDSQQMQGSRAPMATAAERFLPGGAALIVAIGGVFAAATSVNASFIVPARLAITVAEDRSLPRLFARVHSGTGTPILGLTLSLFVSTALLWTGKYVLALNIAVLSLMLVYLLHSVAFLLLPRRNPDLAAAVTLRVGRRMQRGAAWVAIFALLALITSSVWDAVEKIRTLPFAERSFTSIELICGWSLIGAVLFVAARRLGGRRD